MPSEECDVGVDEQDKELGEDSTTETNEGKDVVVLPGEGGKKDLGVMRAEEPEGDSREDSAPERTGWGDDAVEEGEKKDVSVLPREGRVKKRKENKRHKQRPTTFGKQSCNLCNFKSDWAYPAEIRRHKRNVHGTGNFPCKECGKTFRSLDYVRSHHRRKHKTKEESRASGKGQERKQWKRREPETSPIGEFSQCPLCDKPVQGKAMKRHLHYCKKANCEQCNINITVHNMDRHIRVVHPESEAGKMLQALKDKRLKGERRRRNGGKKRSEKGGEEGKKKSGNASARVKDKERRREISGGTTKGGRKSAERSSQEEKKGGKKIAPAPVNRQKCKLCNYRARDAVMTAHIMKIHVIDREK